LRYLGGCDKVTNDGLRAVAELTSLIHLAFNLWGCSLVTDVGLQHLSDLKQLTLLGVSFCDTSEAAEEELRQQIPGLSIEHEHPSDEEDSDAEDSDADDFAF
jgi:hypothetical protein